MEIFTPDVFDEDFTQELFALHRAVNAEDEPDWTAPCSRAFAPNLRLPRPDEDVVHRCVRLDGKLAGHLSVHLPKKTNRHFAEIEVTVHPQMRRRGVGAALANCAIDLTRRMGRTTVAGGTLGPWPQGVPRGEGGKRFAESMGFSLALTEVLRVSDLDQLDPREEERLYQEALEASRGYETVAWSERAPEDVVAPLGTLNSTFMSEAPMGDLELENERFDVDEARAREERALACGLLVCAVAARPVGSKEIVADTFIGVPSDPGDQADQWITIVAPKHRGHKLGLLVKLENLRQLRRLRPGVRRIMTGNADVNAHMIAINEKLGFKVRDASFEYQLKRE